MSTTLKQVEALPATYPAYPPSPDILSAAAAALDAAMIWQRIEAYIVHRFTARDVVWIAEGCGEWVPPLTPVSISTVEVWSGADEWEDVTANATPSPLGGFWLPATGPYRFTGVAGGGSPAPPVPEGVREAFRRLAEYFAAKSGTPGATSSRITSGSVTIANSRSASWMASALQNSGAADLLRPYRRA